VTLVGQQGDGRGHKVLFVVLLAARFCHNCFIINPTVEQLGLII
jgi:hypothetical protein